MIAGQPGREAIQKYEWYYSGKGSSGVSTTDCSDEPVVPTALCAAVAVSVTVWMPLFVSGGLCVVLCHHQPMKGRVKFTALITSYETVLSDFTEFHQVRV